VKYRKKPVVIEARQLTQDNMEEIAEWCNGGTREIKISNPPKPKALEIYTLEGIMDAWEGDYIIKGVKGEFYPCKPDIFKATYEKVKND
jgi:hypothetical protein